MGDFAQLNKQKITYCPLCGEKISSDYATEECPSCKFNFQLIQGAEDEPIQKTRPAEVSQFAIAMMGIQSGLAAVLGFLFLNFADSTYFGFLQIIMVIQFTSIIILIIFAVFLHLRKAIPIIKIGSFVLGIVSLPIGICTFAAAFSLTPSRRWCIICNKPIKWGSSSIECSHCQVSMHEWGPCRVARFQRVKASFDRELLQSQIECTCPNCLEPLNPQPLGDIHND
ncbi:MAG: hypothetical protein ACFFD8_09355 [Candidatus Thorarchaeota archaeon]